MDTNLQHEDLLIKLRAKLNEEKVKLWEPPFILPDNAISPSLQDLAKRYATELSLDVETVQQALHELQLHSIDRSKANAEFKETGCATFRVKATITGGKPRNIKVQKMLTVPGSELIKVVAEDMSVSESRVKLIVNGRVIKPEPNLEEQGIKNGSQIMALIMSEAPEAVKKEDTMYMEMKATRDDATLLSEYVEDLADDDEYMKLEDQSGQTVELPAAEKRALLIGLALHERGRAAARQKDYPLALVLLLEADRQLSECSSSILKTVDNWALLQLDVAWCYLCLQSLSSASDAAVRLARAEESFRNSYGENHQRLIALKGTAANERVLLMRMYLLQGIVAYHQNRREDAKALLEKAEAELNSVKVDETAVAALAELGWSRGEARRGLRATGGDPTRAHHWLADNRQQRKTARENHARRRQASRAGLCEDGTPVRPALVSALVSMGYSPTLAARALRNSNNSVADAVRLITEQPDMLADSEHSSDDSDSPSVSESSVVADEKLIIELSAMGYEPDMAAAALRSTGNNASAAVELLVAGGGNLPTAAGPSNPSTSSEGAKRTKHKTHKKDKRKKEREMALKRLTSAIHMEEDDHLDASLDDEEEYLAQYKSLL